MDYIDTSMKNWWESQKGGVKKSKLKKKSKKKGIRRPYRIFKSQKGRYIRKKGKKLRIKSNKPTLDLIRRMMREGKMKTTLPNTGIDASASSGPGPKVNTTPTPLQNFVNQSKAIVPFTQTSNRAELDLTKARIDKELENKQKEIVELRNQFNTQARDQTLALTQAQTKAQNDALALIQANKKPDGPDPQTQIELNKLKSKFQRKQDMLKVRAEAAIDRLKNENLNTNTFFSTQGRLFQIQLDNIANIAKNQHLAISNDVVQTKNAEQQQAENEIQRLKDDKASIETRARELEANEHKTDAEINELNELNLKLSETNQKLNEEIQRRDTIILEGQQKLQLEKQKNEELTRDLERSRQENIRFIEETNQKKATTDAAEILRIAKEKEEEKQQKEERKSEKLRIKQEADEKIKREEDEKLRIKQEEDEKFLAELTENIIKEEKQEEEKSEVEGQISSFIKTLLKDDAIDILTKSDTDLPKFNKKTLSQIKSLMLLDKKVRNYIFNNYIDPKPIPVIPSEKILRKSKSKDFVQDKIVKPLKRSKSKDSGLDKIVQPKQKQIKNTELEDLMKEDALSIQKKKKVEEDAAKFERMEKNKPNRDKRYGELLDFQNNSQYTKLVEIANDLGIDLRYIEHTARKSVQKPGTMLISEILSEEFPDFAINIVPGKGNNKIDNTGQETKIGPDGLYNTEIEHIMKDYPDFVGVISSDEIPSLVGKVKPNKKISFIMNLDKSNQPGSHWVSVLIDPVNSQSVEYYDSYGMPPPNNFSKDIKLLVDKMKPDVYLKYKINKVKHQHDSSSTCGWHSMRWLLNRYAGIPFKDCTGWNEVNKGEKAAQDLKKKFKKFGYI